MDNLPWAWLGLVVGPLAMDRGVQELDNLPWAWLGQVAGPLALGRGLHELDNLPWACVRQVAGLPAVAWAHRSWATSPGRGWGRRRALQR